MIFVILRISVSEIIRAEAELLTVSTDELALSIHVVVVVLEDVASVCTSHGKIHVHVVGVDHC